MTLSYLAYKRGVAIATPMRGLELPRNDAVLFGEYTRASSPCPPLSELSFSHWDNYLACLAALYRALGDYGGSPEGLAVLRETGF